MNWEAVGALGELIGSLAVLLTLVYLAYQVKQARIESRATLLQHRSDASRQLWLSDVANPDVLSAHIEANTKLGAPLNPAADEVMKATGVDAVKAWMIVQRAAAHLFHRQTMFLSDLTDSERKTIDHQIKSIFMSGVNRIYFDKLYESHRNGVGGFDPGFVEHVHSLLDNESGA